MSIALISVKTEEAEACFLQGYRDCSTAAGEVAGAAGGDEPRALWQQQGKKKEAHQLLSEIYGWFTEGFDTKDLQEAKALLEELAEGSDGLCTRSSTKSPPSSSSGGGSPIGRCKLQFALMRKQLEALKEELIEGATAR